MIYVPSNIENAIRNLENAVRRCGMDTDPGEECEIRRRVEECRNHLNNLILQQINLTRSLAICEGVRSKEKAA